MAKNVSTLTKKEQKAINQEREKVHKAMLKRAKDERYLPKSLNPEAYISLSHINKIYPNHVQAVYDFNLDIKEKEFIVFVGPSGCGKSTTLRMIAGLEDITYGDLFIDGVYANELPSKARHVGVVFQSYALFPHMNVYDNLAFGLQINHVDKKEIDERVHKVAKTLELEEYLGRKPAELSGGQCQRVALGRAIIKDCKVFLMDEPLSNLDAKLRVQMRSEIVRLHNALNTTTIYVTHDQTEAMTMASRIVVMSKGYIQQIGTPSEIYNHPSNIFVATFIGSPAMNVLNAREEKGKLIFGGNYSFPLEKNFSEVVDKFYDSEIASYKNRIEELKDVFLERFLNDKKYLAIAGALDIEKEKANFAKMIKAFDEKILEGLVKEKEEIYQTGDKETRMDVLKAFLREYLYLYNVKNNPEIKELETTLGKLINIKDVENKDFLLGIRPEDILDIKEPTKKETSGKFDFNISLLELVGNEYFAHVDLGENKDLIFKISADNPLKMGDVVSVSFIKNKIHIFDTITKKTIY